ncbi:hypothetical protein T492DRAFT_17583 [Pavlovales sp. CCMP2436]|nr:hypothetical protein T492DRAFT_17583 [Pavlovales sp. CCMP2436]
MEPDLPRSATCRRDGPRLAVDHNQENKSDLKLSTQREVRRLHRVPSDATVELSVARACSAPRDQSRYQWNRSPFNPSPRPSRRPSRRPIPGPSPSLSPSPRPWSRLTRTCRPLRDCSTARGEPRGRAAAGPVICARLCHMLTHPPIARCCAHLQRLLRRHLAFAASDDGDNGAARAGCRRRLGPAPGRIQRARPSYLPGSRSRSLYPDHHAHTPPNGDDLVPDGGSVEALGSPTRFDARTRRCHFHREHLDLGPADRREPRTGVPACIHSDGDSVSLDGVPEPGNSVHMLLFVKRHKRTILKKGIAARNKTRDVHSQAWSAPDFSHHHTLYKCVCACVCAITPSPLPNSPPPIPTRDK